MSAESYNRRLFLKLAASGLSGFTLSSLVNKASANLRYLDPATRSPTQGQVRDLPLYVGWLFPR